MNSKQENTSCRILYKDWKMLLEKLANLLVFQNENIIRNSFLKEMNIVCFQRKRWSLFRVGRFEICEIYFNSVKSISMANLIEVKMMLHN